jgi:hypothetical protein
MTRPFSADYPSFQISKAEPDMLKNPQVPIRNPTRITQLEGAKSRIDPNSPLAKQVGA